MAERGIDEPIGSSREDLLERAPFARALARQVVTAPTGAGFVLAVLGRWGDGKTSVLNMTKEHVEELESDALNFTFNPWLFESSEQLVARFLNELGLRITQEKRLDKRARDRAGNLLRDYGSVLGKPGEALSKKLQSKTIFDARSEAEHALAGLRRRVVIYVDDIDRLTSSEVRDVMRLVKLVANFPATVFVLAFDRDRVQRALAEGAPGEAQARDGRAYLEKIVQVSADLPVLSRGTLMRLLSSELQALLGRLGRPPEDDERLREVMSRIVARQLHTLRDVRRFLASIGMTVELIGGEIDLTDVLALESVRVFSPEIHGRLVNHVDDLTRTPGPLDPEGTEDEIRERLEELAKSAGPHTSAIRALFTVVFPATRRLFRSTGPDHSPTQRWRAQRRVAVRSNLLFYLSRVVTPDTIANTEVEAVLRALDNRAELTSLLQPLSGAQLAALVERLADHATEIRPEHARPGAAAFLSVAERLPAAKPQNMGLDEQGRLLALVGHLLSLVPDSDRGSFYDALFTDAASASTRWMILASSRPDGNSASFPPMTDDQWRRLERRLRDELLTARATSLMMEQHLVHLFEVLRGSDDGRAHLRDVGEDDDLLIRLLNSAVVVAFDGRHRRFLPWDKLRGAFGEQWLARRVSTLERVGRDDVGVRIARHYLDHGEGEPLQPHQP